MSKTPHALIAGAGIGGLAAALGLARNGWTVTLLERGDLGVDIGAGLQISPNASAVLRAWSVLPRLVPTALQPQAIRVLRGDDGGTITRLPLENAERRWGAPYLLVHRADLHQALVEEVARDPHVAIVERTALVGFDTKGDGVDVIATQGAKDVSYQGDILIGADGVRSKVRAQLAKASNENDESPSTARHVAWRALIDADRAPPSARSPETKLCLGHGAHLVHYPLRAASFINVVAVIDESVPIDWTADLWSQAGDPRIITARFAAWNSPIPDLVAAADHWNVWPLAERAPPPYRSSGRVVLLGDAAHPILPFLAQGAAQAIEDAAVLARFLTPGCDIAMALAAFADARRGRVRRVQAESERQARIYHLPAPAALLRDWALRAMGPQRILTRYDWLYGHKILSAESPPAG